MRVFSCRLELSSSSSMLEPARNSEWAGLLLWPGFEITSSRYKRQYPIIRKVFQNMMGSEIVVISKAILTKKSTIAKNVL